jgi:hypothetical protein
MLLIRTSQLNRNPRIHGNDSLNLGRSIDTARHPQNRDGHLQASSLRIAESCLPQCCHVFLDHNPHNAYNGIIHEVQASNEHGTVWSGHGDWDSGDAKDLARRDQHPLSNSTELLARPTLHLLQVFLGSGKPHEAMRHANFDPGTHAFGRVG